MEIKQLGPHRLQILMSGGELNEMGLTYDKIDYTSPQTKALMLSLLDSARVTTGFEPERRIFIEIYPNGEGGCVIFFSDLDHSEPKRWRVRRHAPSPVIYVFDDINVLISSAVKLFRRYSHRILKSALFKLGDEWRLALYPLDTLENKTLSFMDEFAPRAGEGPLAMAWLEEHGEQILEKDAVDLLSAYFG